MGRFRSFIQKGDIMKRNLFKRTISVLLTGIFLCSQSATLLASESISGYSVTIEELAGEDNTLQRETGEREGIDNQFLTVSDNKQEEGVDNSDFQVSDNGEGNSEILPSTVSFNEGEESREDMPSSVSDNEEEEIGNNCPVSVSDNGTDEDYLNDFDEVSVPDNDIIDTAGSGESHEVFVVSTVSEFLEKLGSNRTIILKDGVYNFDNTINLYISEQTGQWEWNYYGYKDLIIGAQNAGRAEILSCNPVHPVFDIYKCQNITIDGLIIGHDPAGDEGCLEDGYVLKMEQSTDIIISECDLFGCGWNALDITACGKIDVNNSVLRDCTYNAIWYSAEEQEMILNLNNCILSGNTDTDIAENENISLINGECSDFVSAQIKCNNCRVINNRCRHLTSDSCGDSVKFDSACKFYNNAFHDQSTKNYGICLNGATWEVKNNTLYLGYDIAMDNGDVLKNTAEVVLPYSSSSLPWKGISYSEKIEKIGYLADIDLPHDGVKRIKMTPKMFKNSSLVNYNSELSELAVCLSTMVYESDEKDEKGNNKKSEDEEHERMAWNFQKLGFEKTSPDHYINYFPDDDAYKDDPKIKGQFSPAWIVNKKICTDSGEYELLVVVVEGTHGKEWIDNFDPGIDDMHVGFYRAADDIRKKINKYISEHISGSNIKLLVTGHSRGGAVANIIGKMVDDGEIMVNPVNAFIYTYATPNVSRDSGTLASHPWDSYNMDYLAHYKYSNIFNIINPEDFVTKVLPAKWGYGRYGISYVLPSVSIKDDEEYRTFLEKVISLKKQFDTSSEYDGYEPYKGGMRPVKDYVSALIKSVQNIEQYHLKYVGADPLVNGSTKNRVSEKTNCLYHPYSLNTLFRDVLAKFLVGEKSLSTLINECSNPSLYGLVGWKTLGFFTVNQYFSKYFGYGHAAESYMALLDATDVSTLKGPKYYDEMIISCPVDVKIKNNEGAIIGETKNNSVVETTEELALTVNGESKSFIMNDDSDYSIELSGYGSGTMYYSICKYDADAGEISRVVYQNVPLEIGKTYSQDFKDFTGAADAPVLDDQGIVIEKTDSISFNELGKLSIKVITDGAGFADGYENLTVGDYVTLKASPYSNNQFIGWYDMEGNLLSEEETYGVSVSKNAVYNAKFTNNPLDDDEYIPEDAPDGVWIKGLKKSYSYTGSPIMPNFKIYHGRTLLKLGKDYSLKYIKNTKPGTATITIKMKGNYKGSYDKTFTIDKVTMSENVVADTAYVAYKPEKVQKVKPVLYLNEKKLDSKLFTYRYDSATASGNGVPYCDVGTYTVRILPKNNKIYLGEKVVDLIIVDKPLMSTVKITPNKNKLPYTGNPVEPTFTLSLKDMPLREGTDYSVSFNDAHTEPGKHKVSFIGNNKDYFGKKTYTFTITGKYDLESAKASIELDPSSLDPQGNAIHTYGGAKPTVKVTYEGKNLTSGKDYSASYKNNKTVAKVTDEAPPYVIIKGKGSYKGQVKKYYNIVQRDINTLSLNIADVVYSTKPDKYLNTSYIFTNENYKSQGMKKDRDFTVTVSGNYDSIPESGTVIYVKVTGEGNYKGDIDASYKIIDPSYNFSKATVVVNNGKAYEYTGKAIKPSVSQLSVTIGKNKTPVSKENYEIVGYYNNVNKGTAYVRLRGKNQYAGIKLVKFKIGAAKIEDLWSGIILKLRESFAW